MEKTFCILDYETYSEADIKKVGAFEYSVHPSTKILCAAFRIGTKESLAAAKTRLWVPNGTVDGLRKLATLTQALRNPSVELVAHNAFFEQVITQNVLNRTGFISKIPVERWHCTAAMARSVGIPGNLEGAGAALNLSHQKDKEGHKLMLKLCKPKRPSKKDPSTRITDPALLKRLYEYCVKDVEAETELFLRLPPLHPKERKFWVLDQKTNMRGFAVDRELCKGALELIAKESVAMDRRVREITKGKLYSARQRNALLGYLRHGGVKLPDLKSGTVREILKREFKDPKHKELLEIRDAISRSSTAKYAAFEIRSRHDGRARDNTIFFGAHTGRQAGTGLQPQNLFKTVLPQKDVEVGLELMRRRDVHAIRGLFPKPMELYASALRSCIVAGNGMVLDVGDFATIEVRVLFWLAGHVNGLEALASGRDLYCEMAAKIYGLDSDAIREKYKSGCKDALNKRQLGKQTVLGAGFGIGVGGEKFFATAMQYGLEITLEIAQAAVRAYRELHPRIPAFWSNIERAAVLATQNPGKRYRIGYLIWERQGDFLTCTLPIGRKLSYYKPRITMTRTPWGEKPILSYMGLLSPSKVFGRITTWGGKLTENVVQAVARDLLKESLLELEEQGESLPVLEVHDEIVGEREDAKGSLKTFIDTMSKPRDWAKGLPIKVEGWSERRYRK